MVTPAPVSGEGYSMGFTSETRSNYLRGGLTFGTAYDSDATTGTNGQPISDVSYSIWPTISLDQTRSRLHWVLNYAPGFTFYQKTSSLNQADQNLAVNLIYRLSPHVTLTVRDAFAKTSNILNQPTSDLASPVSGGVSVPNNSVIAPITDTLTNNANASITYQFSANGMVGASGTFTNLHYPNPGQVPGLSDSSSRGGSAFYNHRLSKMHYIGATYQYQWFLAYPSGGQSETQTQSVFLFYTVYFKPTLSVSLFGGPQYSNTQQFGLPTSTSWTPAGGASMSWQGKLTSVAASYSRTINRVGGSSRVEHREWVISSATHPNVEYVGWSELRQQRCSGRVAHIPDQWTYNLGKCFGAATDRRTFQRAGAIYTFAPELQRCRRNIQRSQPKSCGGFDLVSVFKTVGPLIREGIYGR
jgi:hypothetical protein